MRHKELEAFWKRCLMKTAAAPAKRGGGGGKVAVAEPDPEPELDDAGNPIEADLEPKLDDAGNPIEADLEPKLDADGNPIEEPELDADGNPIKAEDGDDDKEDPRDQTIAELKERLEALEKGGKKADEEPKAMSEEDWKKLEDDWGLAEKDGMPGSFGRKSIQQIIRLMGGMLNRELGGFKKEAVIAELAREKGFEDIKGYRKGMEEFLKDFDPSLHSDKNMLKKALTYARGLASTGKFKKALNSREQERKINAGGVHGKPGGKGGGKTVSLTAEQKQAARMAKMSEQEYIKYLTTDNLDDIDLPE